MNKIKLELRKLDYYKRRQFISNLCVVCDRDFGNSEVDPSDVLDPNEMTQMFLIDCSCEQILEALEMTIGKIDLMDTYEVTDEILDAIESEVGMGCGAWDMVPPKEIIAAAWKFLPRLNS